MKCAEALRVQNRFDDEVDAASAVAIDAHVETCDECRGLLQDLEAVRHGLRRSAAAQHAPAALRTRVMAALDRERPATRRRWPAYWAGAASGFGAAVLAAGIAWALLLMPVSPLSDDLVSAHLRSLMPDHLIDVASTDKHTVKPWFAGHADVSPVVADFAPQGYRLMGGRADYLDRQRAAVVVYQHGPHVINVFSWAAGRYALPTSTERNGYRLVFWQSGDLAYCAVSDTGWDELLDLAQLLRDVNIREERGRP